MPDNPLPDLTLRSSACRVDRRSAPEELGGADAVFSVAPDGHIVLSIRRAADRYELLDVRMTTRAAARMRDSIVLIALDDSGALRDPRIGVVWRVSAEGYVVEFPVDLAEVAAWFGFAIGLDRWTPDHGTTWDW